MINYHETCWERTQILIGEQGLNDLQKSHVLIAGLGGVGSFAAEALARAGIGTLTLIDHDVINPSNLNRQLLALHSTIGRYKVDIMAERIAEINPLCQLNIFSEFISIDNIKNFLIQYPNQIIDAIDSFNSKIALIETAVQMQIPIVSSMGAGGKLDLNKIHVGDLWDTRVCPLARKVRACLKKRGIGRGITVVWSEEIPRPPKQGPHCLKHGTISYLPAMFGLFLAGIVIQRLLKSQI